MAKRGTRQFRYNVYYPNGEKMLGAATRMSDRPTLREIGTAIGRYFEGAELLHISIPKSQHDGPSDMFVDGNSIQKGLPRNEWATRLYLLSRPSGENGPENVLYIAGVAVVFEDSVCLNSRAGAVRVQRSIGQIRCRFRHWLHRLSDQRKLPMQM